MCIAIYHFSVGMQENFNLFRRHFARPVGEKGIVSTGLPLSALRGVGTLVCSAIMAQSSNHKR